VILCCSEKTYKQIGDDMGVSQHTVHGYRESVFYKLEIKTRTGLVIFALTTGMVKL
jgi:two-component system invasion response regulator UvrY